MYAVSHVLGTCATSELEMAGGRMFVRIFVLTLALTVAGAAAAPAALRGQSFDREMFEVSDSFPYEVTVRRSAAVVGAGLGFTAVSRVLPMIQPRETAAEYGPERLDRKDVNRVDRYFMNPYDEFLQNAGHATFFVTMLTPFPTILSREFGEIFQLGVMLGQTVLLSYGTKETLLHFFPRFRPHAYYDDTPNRLQEDDGSRKSFFSGHSSHTFAVATFATIITRDLYPESRASLVVGGVGYGLAASVSAMRVAGGRHYLSDVVVGAAWGSLVGWAVPRIYRRDSGEDTLRVTPTVGEFGPGIMLRYRPR
ncbi:MAG: phosphatase PAP2 family protein [Spirochaetaceae bacterium]|nr:MAG: phosphatase PAP2 family protein [Spirochaetaceae bacterium]